MDKTKAESHRDLEQYGLHLIENRSIQGRLDFERPVFIFGPRRIKHCAIGAFTLLNGYQSVSIYATRIGRYCSIAEDTVIGPPEHPTDWLSSSVAMFTRPENSPVMYRDPDFARLAPESSPKPMFATPGRTVIGHDVWIGAAAFIKRDLTIGHGAIIGAGSVVVKDVPPYAIVAGVPARVVRMRFPEAIIERLLTLEWWKYDLAPHKHDIDFANIEAALEVIEDKLVQGALSLLQPETYRVSQPSHIRSSGIESHYEVERLAQPLY